MAGFKTGIEKETLENTFFRRVLYTAPHSQLVLMCLRPAEEIGMETHLENDQFFRFESGSGKVVINGEEILVKDGDCVIVPAGSQHNVINSAGDSELKFYTIYSPSHHPDGTIHKTKEDAMAAE